MLAGDRERFEAMNHAGGLRGLPAAFVLPGLAAVSAAWFTPSVLGGGMIETVGALCLTAVLGTAPAADGAKPEAPPLRAVEKDLGALRTWFNENRGRPRLIVLLSPT